MIKTVKDAYKRNIASIAFGSFLKIIEAVFDLLIPLFMKAIIDLTHYQSPEAIPQVFSARLAAFIRAFNFSNNPLYDALTGGLIILMMGIVGYIITMISHYIAAHASVNVGSAARAALYQKILVFSKNDRKNIGHSKLLTVMNSDTYQLQQGVFLFVRLAVRAPFILIGALIVSFVLDWRVGLAYVAIVPLILLVYGLVLRKTSKGYVEIQSDLDQLSNQVSEVTQGAKVLRASNNQDLENDKFQTKTAAYEAKSVRDNRFNGLINPLTFAITSLVLVTIILLLQKDCLFYQRSLPRCLI